MTEIERKRAKSVENTLIELGYRSIRFIDGEEWRPVDEIGHWFGTTDETDIQTPGTVQEYARLFDEESGEVRALAGKHPPTSNGSSSDLGSEVNGNRAAAEEDSPARETLFRDISRNEGKRLKSHYSQCPNTCTMAYLAGRKCKRKTGNRKGAIMEDKPSHEALVTSSNLLALKSWDEGLVPTNLDEITIQVSSASDEEGKVWPTLEISEGATAVSIPVADRPFELKEPWDGKLDILKVVG